MISTLPDIESYFVDLIYEVISSVERTDLVEFLEAFTVVNPIKVVYSLRVVYAVKSVDAIICRY